MWAQTYLMQNFPRISDLASILTSEAAFQSTSEALILASKCYIWFLGLIGACLREDFKLNTWQFYFKYDINCLPKIPLYVHKSTKYFASLLYMFSLQNPKIKWKSRRFAIPCRFVMISATDRKEDDPNFYQILVIFPHTKMDFMYFSGQFFK